MKVKDKVIDVKYSQFKRYIYKYNNIYTNIIFYWWVFDRMMIGVAYEWLV